MISLIETFEPLIQANLAYISRDHLINDLKKADCLRTFEVRETYIVHSPTEINYWMSNEVLTRTILSQPP